MRRFWIGVAVVCSTLSFVLPFILTSLGYVGSGLMRIVYAGVALEILSITMIILSKKEIPKKYNKRTIAEVIEVSQTGLHVNRLPQFSITVSFFTENRQKVYTKTKAILNFSNAALVQPGVKLEILYQENKPEKIVLAPPEEARPDSKYADREYAAFVNKEKQRGRLYRTICIITAVVGFIGFLVGMGFNFTSSAFRTPDYSVLYTGFVVLILSMINMKRLSRAMTIVCLAGALITMGFVGYSIYYYANEQVKEEAPMTVFTVCNEVKFELK